MGGKKKLKIRPHGSTWLLIGVNVFVFLMVFSMPEAMRNSVFLGFSFSSGTLLEVWRWFTSLFLHASASHLFFNMLGLYFFGKILQEEVNLEWYLSVYFASGLVGNFVFMLTSAAPVVGASGCVFGVMGAAMLLNPIKRIRLYLFPLPVGIIAILFIIVETLVVYFQPHEYSGVANVAHLAGVISGSVFAFFYDWRRASKSVVFLIVCIALLIILAPIFALIAGIAGIVLGFIDNLVGFFLYGIAGLLSFIWG